jgi:hypothetical protein
MSPRYFLATAILQTKVSVGANTSQEARSRVEGMIRDLNGLLQFYTLNSKMLKAKSITVKMGGHK